jgi:hypothetical protein
VFCDPTEEIDVECENKAVAFLGMWAVCWDF